MRLPKWKKITKKRYTRLKDNPMCNVKADPIYEKGSGIIAQMKGEAKIIGYEYYLQVGVELVLVMGSEQIKKIYNLYKQNE
jgi:hypothetical protein